LSSTPTVLLRRLANDRAMALGRYPSFVAAARTRARRSSLTWGFWRITNEAKARDTPASRATSSNVAGPLIPLTEPRGAVILASINSLERSKGKEQD
jgi:hypothetical protein